MGTAQPRVQGDGSLERRGRAPVVSDERVRLADPTPRQGVVAGTLPGALERDERLFNAAISASSNARSASRSAGAPSPGIGPVQRAAFKRCSGLSIAVTAGLEFTTGGCVGARVPGSTRGPRWRTTLGRPVARTAPGRCPVTRTPVTARTDGPPSHARRASQRRRRLRRTLSSETGARQLAHERLSLQHASWWTAPHCSQLATLSSPGTTDAWQ